MNLLLLRKKKGMTQKEAAEILDCSMVSFGKYEREEREPSIDMLKKMAKLFDVSVDYLIGNADDVVRNELSEYEIELVEASRASDDRARRDALRVLKEYREED